MKEMTKRFLVFLILFCILIMGLWTVFALFILPILPESNIKFGLAILGYGTIFVFSSLTLLHLYEKDIPEDDDRL